MLALFSFTGYGSNRQTHLQVLDGIAFFDVNRISLALYSKGLRLNDAHTFKAVLYFPRPVFKGIKTTHPGRFP